MDECELDYVIEWVFSMCVCVRVRVCVCWDFFAVKTELVCLIEREESRTNIIIIIIIIL